MPIIKPTQTLRGMELDMRISPLLGKELYDEILKSVAATQRFILTTLPDVLVITQKQFVSLHDFTQELYNTTDRFMFTPHNAMEIVIDRKVDTVQEVEQVMRINDQIDKAIQEEKDEQSTEQ